MLQRRAREKKAQKGRKEREEAKQQGKDREAPGLGKGRRKQRAKQAMFPASPYAHKCWRAGYQESQQAACGGKGAKGAGMCATHAMLVCPVPVLSLVFVPSPGVCLFCSCSCFCSLTKTFLKTSRTTKMKCPCPCPCLFSPVHHHAGMSRTSKEHTHVISQNIYIWRSTAKGKAPERARVK